MELWSDGVLAGIGRRTPNGDPIVAVPCVHAGDATPEPRPVKSGLRSYAIKCNDLQARAEISGSVQGARKVKEAVQ
jgi:hypothetical protein